jgi:phage FluMu protein Com
VLHTLTKTDPVTKRRPGRCPRCRMVNQLHAGDDAITKCRNCGRWLSEREYQEEMLDVAEAVARHSR